MEIINKKTTELIPYDKNPRNNDPAVNAVMRSIEEFGFKVPIVIDKDNVVVAGHTRLRAAKKLHMSEVPCVVADDLDDEQIRAFRLADNKTAELAEWDFDLLDEEIQNIFDIDMTDFGFDIFDPVEEHEEQQEKTQERVANIVNLADGWYAGDGYYDIPIIEPVYELPEIKQWIPFNYVLSDENPEGKAVHFFIDDYQFERVWKEPEKYVDKLKQYVCIASPDFSPYGDMPVALQIYNHYRKHWVAAYMQERGVTVIPTIRGSTNPKSLDWFLDGEPEGGIVVVSTMWASKEETDASEHDKAMIERLHPCKVFVYGKDDGTDYGAPVEYIPTFTEKFRGKDDEQT